MNCVKCRNEVYDGHTKLCKKHFYARNQTYIYLGKVISQDKKTRRTCLMCDKIFVSTGNRRCDLCNRTTDCHYESNLTLYVRV
jgi:hypothetical protein